MTTQNTSLKVRKAPPEHTFNWILSVAGTVIDDYQTRHDAIAEGTIIADRVNVGLEAQRPSGEWGVIRPLNSELPRLGERDEDDQEKEEDQILVPR